MAFKLGENVIVGNKILTKKGWEKIVEKQDDKVVTNNGTEIKYGDDVYGWKIK